MKYILEYGDTKENVSFECENPAIAVEAYAKAIAKMIGNSVTVFLDTPALFSVGEAGQTPVDSKLFKGYTDKELVCFRGSSEEGKTKFPDKGPSKIDLLSRGGCGLCGSVCGGTCEDKVLDLKVPLRDSFETINSSWIAKVSWEARNQSICVHFRNSGFIVYKASYELFNDFCEWCECECGSPGKFYNQNLKGKEVIWRR